MERQQGVASPPVTIHFNAYALAVILFSLLALGYQRENSHCGILQSQFASNFGHHIAYFT